MIYSKQLDRSRMVFTHITTSHLVLKSMMFYIEVPMLSKPTMMALVAKGDPLTSINHCETLPSSTETTEASVGLDRFHPTTPFLTNSTCHTDATAENYVKSQLLHNNSCNEHHGTKQLVNLALICHEIEYHMAHWDSLFSALATVLNGCQEMQSIDCNMQLNSNTAMHNALQPTTMTKRTTTTMMMTKAAKMSPYSTKPSLPVTPDQMTDQCNNNNNSEIL